jgi:hypothetical protein
LLVAFEPYSRQAIRIRPELGGNRPALPIGIAVALRAKSNAQEQAASCLPLRGCFAATDPAS